MMFVWGQSLTPGALVEIHSESALGLIISRDPEYLYLWNVLIDGVVVSVHSSRLRIAL
jgi:hypothetical protein